MTATDDRTAMPLPPTSSSPHFSAALRARVHADPGTPGYRDSLPFDDGAEALREAIYHRHILPAADWLIGTSDSPLLAIAANSPWEAAMSIRFLFDVCEFAGEHGHLDVIKRVESLVPPVTRWLLDQSVRHDGSGCCWDHGAWDTAAVAVALTDVLIHYGDQLDAAMVDSITTAIVDALTWLYRRFRQWPIHVKYPFGDADLAQVGIAFTKVAVSAPTIHQKFVDLDPTANANAAGEVIQFLLHHKTSESDWWDDPFTAAEVIEALTRYHAYQRSLGTTDSSGGPTLGDIEAMLVRACAYIERTQVDGMWGVHVDTIRTLCGYVLLGRFMTTSDQADCPAAAFVPEIHIVFKALRWMCDEKQVFDDGSFLHTHFLTVFYAHALSEIYRSWEPSKRPVLSLYDDVVWASPTRTTPERRERMAVEVENAGLHRDLSTERDRSTDLRSSLAAARLVPTRIVLTLSVVGLALVAQVLLASLTGIVTYKVTLAAGRYSFTLAKPGDFIQGLSVIVALLIVTIGGIWKFEAVPRFFQSKSN